MSITLRHPVPGAPRGSRFGWRAAIPSLGIPARGHAGQDFPAASGTPILAAASGTVTYAGWVTTGGGNWTTIDHGNGWRTYYGHQSRFNVRVGQRVSAGQVIGYVGSTGASTGPHLHFELGLWGVRRDPWPYIKAAPKPKPKPAPKPIIILEEEDDMRPTIHFRTTGGAEWSRCHPDIGKDLRPGASRRDGNVTVFRGFEATTNKTVGTAWARQYARGVGNETSRTNRAGYIQIQKQATRLSVATHG